MRPLELVLAALGAAAAGFIGTAIPSRGAVVLGWVLLPAVALLVLLEPAIGMLLVTAVTPLENALVLASGVTAIAALGLLVVGVWLVRRLVRRESWQPLIDTSVFKALIIFLGLILASSVWAKDPAETYGGLFQLVRLSAWCLLIADLAGSWKRIDLLARALVVGGLFACALTIQQFFVGGFYRAGDEIAGGPNGTAAALVIIMPFAFYLLRAQSGHVWRLVGLLYVGLGCIAVGVTFSRMSFIVLPLVLLVQYRNMITQNTKRAWLILIPTIAVIVAASVIPLDRVLQRAETITPYVQDSVGVESDDPAVVADRTVLYRISLSMFQDHPFLGVGYANYRKFSGVYKSRVKGGDIFPGRPSSHTSYLGLLAELGLPGAAAWLAILGVTLRNLAAALPRLSGPWAARQRLLAEAVLYSFLLEIVYGWTINIHREKVFWMLIALALVIRRLACEAGEPSKTTGDPFSSAPASVPVVVR